MLCMRISENKQKQKIDLEKITEKVEFHVNLKIFEKKIGIEGRTRVVLYTYEEG